MGVRTEKTCDEVTRSWAEDTLQPKSMAEGRDSWLHGKSWWDTMASESKMSTSPATPRRRCRTSGEAGQIYDGKDGTSTPSATSHRVSTVVRTPNSAKRPSSTRRPSTPGSAGTVQGGRREVFSSVWSGKAAHGSERSSPSGGNTKALHAELSSQFQALREASGLLPFAPENSFPQRRRDAEQMNPTLALAGRGASSGNGIL